MTTLVKGCLSSSFLTSGAAQCRGRAPFRVVGGQQLRETNNYLAHIAEEDKQAACVHILQQ